jgi:hypothetical protein
VSWVTTQQVSRRESALNDLTERFGINVADAGERGVLEPVSTG